jgi:Rod binding domain-containing protein
MTSAINSPEGAVTTQQSMLSAASNNRQVQSPKVDEAESKRLGDASRQFEAVFLRQMLSCLEKTASVQGGGKDAGSKLYGSMMVDAVADAVSRAGGIGLAAMLKKTLEPQLAGEAAVPTGTSMKLRDSGQADRTAEVVGPRKARVP